MKSKLELPMNFYAFIPLAAAIASVFTSGVVIGRNTHKAEHKSFLLFSLSLQLWAAGDFITWILPQSINPMPFIRLCSVAWLLTGSLFLNFIYTFIGKQKDILFRFIAASGASAIILSLFTSSIVNGYEYEYWGVIVHGGSLFYPACFICTIFPFCYGLYLVVKEWRSCHNERKRQLVLLFTGTLIALVVGIVTDLVCPYLLHHEVVALASTASVIQSLFVFIALTRYKFLSMDIHDIAEELFCNVSDAVIILDPKGRIVKSNAAAISMFGHGMRGMQLENVVNGEYESFTEYAMLETTVSGDGGVKTVYLTQAPIRQLGYLTGWIVLMKDVTVKKQMELELIEKNKELDTFVYKASHDLKGPLSSMRGLVTLAKGADPKNLVTYLNMIDKSISRLDGVLLDLLHVTRIKKSELKSEAINLKKLTEDILDSLQYQSGYRHVTFNLYFSEPVVFYSDRNSINSILQNLIVNSINYRNPEAFASWVDIIVSTGREGAEIVVVDNGTGIAEDIQEKVFEMFYRGSSRTEGTGLGLYIVKSAVARLGGTIRLESREGKGSKFTLFIPQGEPGPPASSAGKKLPVLIDLK